MDDSKSAWQSSRAPTTARRTVIGADAVEWAVYEIHGSYDRRRPDLVFESQALVRRVRSFPPDWATLPDDALMALMDGL